MKQAPSTNHLFTTFVVRNVFDAYTNISLEMNESFQIYMIHKAYFNGFEMESIATAICFWIVRSLIN